MPSLSVAQLRRWPQRYTLVGLCFLAAFVCYIDRINLSVAAIAMQEAYGWSDTTKGFVLSSFFIGYVTFQALTGWLAARYGGKRVLGFAVIWWSAFTMLTPAAAGISFAALIAARIALGAGEAAMFPASWSMYGRWVPPDERGRAVSLTLSGIPLGTVFALATTGWLIVEFGWPSVFYAFGALGFIWAIAWYALVSDDPERDPRVDAAERELIRRQCLSATATVEVPWRALLGKAPVLALIFNHFCANWVLYILAAWLPSYFRDVLGVSLAGAGLLSVAPWVCMFLVANAAGWIADALIRSGWSITAVRKLMQSIGMLGPALFLLLARDVSTTFEATLMMCGALGLHAFCWSGFAANHLDIAPRYAGPLMGVTNTFGSMPGFIGVFVTGWLLDLTGTYDAAFVMVAAINVVGTLVWLRYATGEKVID